MDQSTTGAQVAWLGEADEPQAVVVVVHGGEVSQARRPSWVDHAILRMLPLATELIRVGGGRVGVGLLRTAGRGWNDGARVDDLRWALAQARIRWPDRPLRLLGHSMGGRMVLRCAGDPGVDRAVVLAPWAEYADVPQWRAGPELSLLAVHGTEDPILGVECSQVAVREFARLGAKTRLELVPGGGHALLSASGRAERLAGDFLTASSS